jgi:hypothetical protein
MQDVGESVPPWWLVPTRLRHVFVHQLGLVFEFSKRSNEIAASLGNVAHLGDAILPNFEHYHRLPGLASYQIRRTAWGDRLRFIWSYEYLAGCSFGPK